MLDGDPPWSDDVTHVRFRSTDPSEVERYARGHDLGLRLEPAGGDAPFSTEVTAVTSPLLGIARLRHTRSMAVHTPPAGDAVLVCHCHRGALGWTGSSCWDVRATPGDVVLAPPSGASGFTEEVDTDLVHLDAVAVAHHAAHTCGIDASGLRFTGPSPLSPALRRYWLAAVAHVRDEVLGADPAVTANGVALDSAFQELATALIATFPNTARAAATGGVRSPWRRSVPDAALARVTEYLRARAGEPVGPADVATVSGVPYPDVVAAMRRRDGTDPGRALWNARLRGVRRDLADVGPDGDVTVAKLAARWGFLRHGAFRTVYIREFGEPPERTLRR